MTRSGAQQNAYTTDDYTNYHTTFPKEDLETILKIEADRFQNLAYAESAFKTEARAVLGEYNKNSANPIQKLFEVTRDKAFHVHTYKHTTMGFLKDIEDMPNQYAYSKTFFDRWYRPEYTTVIVAGDVKPEAVFPLVEKYWGGWKRGAHAVTDPAGAAREGPGVRPRALADRHAAVGRRRLPRPGLLGDEEGPPGARHPLRPVVRADVRPLQEARREGAEGRRPPAERRHQRGPRARHGVVARLKKGTDPVYVRDEILQHARGPARRARGRAGASPRSKSNARYGLVRGLDNTETIAGLLARFVRLRRSYGTLNAYYRLVDALTPADLQAAARTYLTDANLVADDALEGRRCRTAIGTIPALATFAAGGEAAPRPARSSPSSRSRRPLPRARGEAPLRGGLRPRSRGQGGPRGAHGRA